MTCPKRLAPFRVRFLNGHVGIAKPDNFLFTFVTGLNNRLLAARYLALGLVASHLRFVNLSHTLSLC